MKNLKKINYLNFLKEFNKDYIEDFQQENNLTREERKQLYFCEALLKKLELIQPEYKFGKTNLPIHAIKEEYLHIPHICNGGTCGATQCSKIGLIVNCDTGCTYPGA